MFIGRLLAALVLPYMGIIMPMNHMFVARVSNDHQKMTRWGSFMICSFLLVVPTAWIVPTWVVFRYDLLWLLLYILSISDAGMSEFLVMRYLNPQVAQLRTASSFASICILLPPPQISPSSSESGDDASVFDGDTDIHGDD